MAKVHAFNVRVGVTRFKHPGMFGGPKSRPEPFLAEACVGAAGRVKPGAVHQSKRWGQRCMVASGASPTEATGNALEALAKSLRRK